MNHGMLSQKRNKHRASQNGGIWQSYSDLMGALLLFFVLLMAFICLQFLSKSEAFEAKQKEVEAKEKALIEEQKKLTLVQRQLEAQQQRLSEQQKIIDDVIGVKAKIIQELSEAFKSSNLKVDIDKSSGTILLDSNILFATDSAELSQEGKAVLKEFLPMYLSVLLGGQYSNSVSEIIVEGHTDHDGPYMHNLNLSQKRAFSVTSFWLDERNKVIGHDILAILRNRLTANGRSFSNLVYDSHGIEDKARSRRVEIKFRLNDEQTIERLKHLVEAE